MRQLIIFICTIFCAQGLRAQGQYTLNTFAVVKSDTDLIYGIEAGFAGIADTLLLDIYKPAGDPNCLRPLLVLVHGGSWVAGSKYDSNIIYIAQEMAKKGYVVAAINYRLGMHKTSNYNLYWACNASISAPCAYVFDSSEVVRAIYRGMQDTKAAIRFMKSRANIDSVDINNVFVAGESAGGFNALAAAYMVEESQKPVDCNSISSATQPDSDLIYCLPAGYSLSRPDLGSVEGSLHIGSFNSTVKGVANFYGGMLDPDLISQSTSKPAIYLFHQGSDVVVDYNYNRVLGRINWECFSPTNICQLYPNTPFAFGSEGIRRQLDSLGTNAPLFLADIVYNYNYMNDCIANGHSIDNVLLRSQHMAELFSLVIDSSGNIPPMNCNVISVSEISEIDVVVYPNPTNSKLYIDHDPGLQIQKICLRDILGKELFTEKNNKNQLEINLPDKIQSGIYFLEVSFSTGIITKKVFVE